ncbi:MAG: hypothetical protein HY703_02860, partial [Gemmatimonadetes bacterium]|nr:hypothetical protein [Gemmatimonadota bacterium]
MEKRILPRLLVFLLAVSALACDAGGPLAPGGTVSITLIPRFSALGGLAADSPGINTIRVTARDASTDSVLPLKQREFRVSPDSAPWRLALELEVQGGAAVQVRLVIELLNVQNGQQSVQWSGQVGPLTVKVGTTSDPAPVELVRGPPGNLAITAVQIAEPVPQLGAGDTADVRASVQGGSAPTQVFW